MAALASAHAPLRPLALGAALLAVGVSFALVAGAVSAFKASSIPTIQNTLADPTPTATALPPAAGNELSKAQAIALVQGRYRARVVRTTLSQDKVGRTLYVFRLLSGSGKVWTVRIDAHTGAEVP
jgi:Peptidase propeptide and YPEB domain